ncbi:aminotransferase class V-fold PLP-dependent enzyme [Nonomuraea sp. MG754425]|uniref:aminotransferase class V-fold PLP-dependent enzyme n=1 Tax=Nonomuraea sp. MG754425 TaxID=2570319 RepID=UPI001F25BA28|nr:aminotransferase class V-fold PLP-dependent enzyme [Nonomuraea sp. MG754425]MCF6469679.1 aminotransferase class V-fold PLP-dependent enzyme [Nonomuraea sp. MG754425]
MIDIDRVRADTPGCRDLVHLNNAGSALPPAVVLETTVDYLREEAANGGYETHQRRESQLDAVYDSLAALIGADASEIALADNATRAWDVVFYGLRFTPGERILTCRSEYGSNAIAYLQQAARTGVEVRVIGDDADGQIDLAHLERELAEPGVRLVSMTHIPTQGGLINPAAAVGALASAAGVPFLLDACQSVGQLDLDVAELKCDVLTGTGRKFLRGPRGTGFLYVREGMTDRFEPAVLDNGSATWTSPGTYELAPGARRYETWEKNYAAVAGLGAAADYALSLGTAAIEARVVALGELLRSTLAGIDGVRIHDLGSSRCGIVSFTVAGLTPDAVKHALAAERVNVSVSKGTSSQWDLPARGLSTVVRASAHYYNTEEEIAQVGSLVERLVADNGPHDPRH